VGEDDLSVEDGAARDGDRALDGDVLAEGEGDGLAASGMFGAERLIDAHDQRGFFRDEEVLVRGGLRGSGGLDGGGAWHLGCGEHAAEEEREQGRESASGHGRLPATG
jgi:hypothetical protein